MTMLVPMTCLLPGATTSTTKSALPCKLDVSIAEAKLGKLVDAEVVLAGLRAMKTRASRNDAP